MSKQSVHATDRPDTTNPTRRAPHRGLTDPCARLPQQPDLKKSSNPWQATIADRANHRVTIDNGEK